MSLPEDLLEQAVHLATLDARRPKQANLRRAVSTAYYALFHLLTAFWRQLRQRALQILGRHLQEALDSRRRKWHHLLLLRFLLLKLLLFERLLAEDILLRGRRRRG